MREHVSWHRNLFGCSTTMSSTKLSFSDRNTVASFKFTSDTTAMLDDKSRDIISNLNEDRFSNTTTSDLPQHKIESCHGIPLCSLEPGISCLLRA